MAKTEPLEKPLWRLLEVDDRDPADLRFTIELSEEEVTALAIGCTTDTIQESCRGMLELAEYRKPKHLRKRLIWEPK